MRCFTYAHLVQSSGPASLYVASPDFAREVGLLRESDALSRVVTLDLGDSEKGRGRRARASSAARVAGSELAASAQQLRSEFSSLVDALTSSPALRSVRELHLRYADLTPASVGPLAAGTTRFARWTEGRGVRPGDGLARALARAKWLAVATVAGAGLCGGLGFALGATGLGVFLGALAGLLGFVGWFTVVDTGKELEDTAAAVAREWNNPYSS